MTLLELIIVVAIVGVLAGMIVPRMSGALGRRELHEAAARLAHTTRAARELAIARAAECAVRIELDSQTYAVVQRDAAGEWQVMQASWLKAERLPRTLRFAGLRTPDGQAYATGTHFVYFFPDGTSSGGAVRLSAADARMQRTITVQAHSGRVYEGDPEEAGPLAEQFDLGD